MSTALKRATREEYFELERLSLEKHEFYDGEIFAMAGAKPVHELVLGNVLAELRAALRGSECRTYPSNLRVMLPTGLYTYPDATVVCGPLEYEMLGGLETVKNPTLIVEVLSKSTEAYDRGRKFEHYKTVPSLQGYLLLSTIEPFVTHYTRNPHDQWMRSAVEGLEQTVELPELQIRLAMSELYYQVEFPPPDDEQFSPIELNPQPHPRGPKS